MRDGRRAIEEDPVFDEIVVEILRKIRQGEAETPRRGGKATYTYVGYEGVAIANYTHPDRVFEYE